MLEKFTVIDYANMTQAEIDVAQRDNARRQRAHDVNSKIDQLLQKYGEWSSQMEPNIS